MKAMNNKVSALLVALTVVAVMAMASPFAAAEDITVAKLAGSWQATVIGEGPGCGFGSKLLTFTLNSSGDSTSGTWHYSTVSCGQDSEPAVFNITSLDSDGSGTADLTVGGNTYTYTIQVNSSVNVFNLVDITDASQYEEGSAIKQ
jgi:hypothetical protein